MKVFRSYRYTHKILVACILFTGLSYFRFFNFISLVGLSTKGFGPSVKVVDLSGSGVEDFKCVKTKTVLSLVRATLCVHHETDYLTVELKKHQIYEEAELTTLLRILLMDPHLALIDVGANVGLYTMYAAGLNRLVVAIECFPPNIERLRKAIQQEKVHDNIVLIENAVYTESGKYFRMLKDNYSIGAQILDVSQPLDGNNDDIYTVQTIRFDEILPFLKKMQIQKALLKIDIESSESFVFQSGSEVFRSVDIPFIMLEWTHVKKIKDRADFLLQFLIKRNYIPTRDGCKPLDLKNVMLWPENIFWIRDAYTNKFCYLEEQIQTDTTQESFSLWQKLADRFP